MQGSERQGLAFGLAEPGDTGWVRIPKDLEEFELYCVLSGGCFYLSKKPFTL